MAIRHIKHQILDGIEHKLCGRCKQWKHLSSFNACKSRIDGLGNRCKSCSAEYRTKTKLNPNKEKPIICKYCNNTFYMLSHDKPSRKFCSPKCYRASQKILKNCATCHKVMNLRLCESHRKYCSSHCAKSARPATCSQCFSIIADPTKRIRYKTMLNFCGNECKNIYIATSRIHNVSLLEKFIQKGLLAQYNLEFHFNRRDTINSELDIYIPSLKLAFELNGIFHYEPIFGIEKLEQTKNNDQRKFQACLERDIELCIIDSSKENSFKERIAKKYLDIITNIINQKLI